MTTQSHIQTISLPLPPPPTPTYQPTPLITSDLEFPPLRPAPNVSKKEEVWQWVHAQRLLQEDAGYISELDLGEPLMPVPRNPLYGMPASASGEMVGLLGGGRYEYVCREVTAGERARIGHLEGAGRGRRRHWKEGEEELEGEFYLCSTWQQYPEGAIRSPSGLPQRHWKEVEEELMEEFYPCTIRPTPSPLEGSYFRTILQHLQGCVPACLSVV